MKILEVEILSTLFASGVYIYHIKVQFLTTNLQHAGYASDKVSHLRYGSIHNGELLQAHGSLFIGLFFICVIGLLNV